MSRKKLRLHYHSSAPGDEPPPGAPASHRRHWFERNPKKTIIFLVGCAIILLDLILAPFYAEKLPNIKNVDYHHDLDANFNGVMAWGPLKYIIHTNSLGFKDKSNRVVQLKNDKHRIVFIGDSFTEGIGFPYEQTFIGLIDQELDKSRYEVLNAGVSSYSPKLYYLKVKYLIETLGLKFDELYVYIDISDIQDEIEYEGFHPVPSKLASGINRLFFMIKRYSFIGNLAAKELAKVNRKALIRDLSSAAPRDNRIAPDRSGNLAAPQTKVWDDPDQYIQEREAWINNAEVFQRWGEKGVALALENMDKLNNLCRKHNVKLTIAVYPWPKEVITNNLNSINVLIWQDFCKTREIPFLNCYPYFFNNRKDENIYRKYYMGGDVHFNLSGQKIMAKAWFDHFNAPSHRPINGSTLPVGQH